MCDTAGELVSSSVHTDTYAHTETSHAEMYRDTDRHTYSHTYMHIDIVTRTRSSSTKRE